MSVGAELLQELHDLLKKYEAEFYYTNDDDGVHVACFGDDVFAGLLSTDNLQEVRDEIMRLRQEDARIKDLAHNHRADCLNFHFWWMSTKGSNSYEGFCKWLTDIRPNYCQCGGPKNRGGHCARCEKLSPPVTYRVIEATGNE